MRSNLAEPLTQIFQRIHLSNTPVLEETSPTREPLSYGQAYRPDLDIMAAASIQAEWQ